MKTIGGKKGGGGKAQVIKGSFIEKVGFKQSLKE